MLGGGLVLLAGAVAWVMRSAVIASLLRCPATRTVSPTVNWLAVAGAFFVPNWVCGVTFTVTSLPRAEWRVQADPLIALIWPVMPPCGASRGALGALKTGGLVEFESVPAQAAIPEMRPNAVNVIAQSLMPRLRDVVAEDLAKVMIASR